MLFLLFFFIVIVLLFGAAYLFWIIRFKNIQKNKIPILVYHKIGNRLEWGITRHKVSQFEQQIKYLKEQGYRSLKTDEAFYREGSKDSKEVLLTFDDGYESVYSHAFPILQRYGFSACIFLVTGYVGKYNEWDVNWGKKFKHLSWKQVKEMANRGFVFGSHTVNHPDLTKLKKKFVEYELRESKEKLEDNLGQMISFLSFPFGKYNQMTVELAQKLGYQKAFTLCSSKRNSYSDSFVQGRVGMYLFDSPLTLRIKLEGGRLFWIEDLKGRIINTFATGTTLVKKPDYSGAESSLITTTTQKPSR
jgi:peptidoglycan/xylan/chitin deacetylase (PgdA/CDA1 family)